LTTATNLYRLQTQFTDETFSASHSDIYNLYLTIGKSTVRFGLEDVTRHKMLAFEEYTLTNVFTPLQLAQQLRELASEHAFLNQTNWHQVRVSVKNQKFTLLPYTLYDPAAAAEYLRLHAELDEYHDRVLTYHHAGIDAVNIFATDQHVLSFLADTFPAEKTQVRHHTSALIETLLHATERTVQKKIYAYAEQNYLTIILITDGALEFCNVFYYATPEDFMYFLIFVMQEQKLNPDQDPLTIWGDISHDSALFDLMRKYIRHVRLGKKPTGLAYSYKFEEHFEHRYLDVFSLHFCE
jgi:hypothetical protein